MLQPRNWRLQFGLRALLLFMAVVAVALTIYRWPWEGVVDNVTHQPRYKTTYHRGWNGQPVMHGWQVIGYTKDVGLEERLYDEGELRFSRGWTNNSITWEINFRGGERHGLYWTLEEGVRTEGMYHHSQKQGVWTSTGPQAILREEWKAGKLHGPRTWTTPAGRLLQSAEYEQGKLVRWNDQPLNVGLARWLEVTIPDAERRGILWSDIEARSSMRVELCYYGQMLYSLDHPQRKLVVQCATYFPEENNLRMTDRYNDAVGKHLLEMLLEDALEHSHTLAFRFGVLHLVPITADSLAWQDRTGVYDVQFVPNSPQAKAWLREVEASLGESKYPGARFRVMFEPQRARRFPQTIAEQETGITIDTTAIIDPERPTLSGYSLSGSNLPRARRDLLGQHLDREKCTCVQNGNTLIIKRLEPVDTGK